MKKSYHKSLKQIEDKDYREIKMREREVSVIEDIKNKHVVIIKNFPSQILSLLVLREIKREHI